MVLELNQLKNVIDEIKTINLKEIRNIKLPEDSCTLQKEYFEDLICSVCLNIVEKPVSCSLCQKLNCRECVDFNKPCYNCRQGDSYKEANLPIFVKNFLCNLNFSCPLGCMQQFKYEFKEKHLNECANKDKIQSKCSLCDLSLNENINNHSKKCEKLKTRCSYCNLEMSKLELEEHLKQCNTYVKPCEICNVGFPSIFQKAHSDYYCQKIVALKLKIHDFIQSI